LLILITKFYILPLPIIKERIIILKM